jgi:3-phenylpropionate/cinnamic acid dioxygenase small subunit
VSTPEQSELARWFAATRFLQHEARLLDDNRLEDWLELLSPDIRYTMPVRVSTIRSEWDRSTSDGYVHFDEDFESLSYRVTHLIQPDARAESVPSRIRRFVTNVEVSDSPGGGLAVTSYLLLTRSQRASPAIDLLSAMREDRLVSFGAGYRLAERRIIVDQVTLALSNLALFL